MPIEIPRAFIGRIDNVQGHSRLVTQAIGPQRPGVSARLRPIPMAPFSPVPPLAAAVLPESPHLEEPLSFAGATEIIQQWYFFGGNLRPQDQAMAFGFYTPSAIRSNTIISAEEIVKHFLTQFPHMPSQIQYLLSCYLGMPTTLAALDPEIIPRPKLRYCSEIIVLEFDEVLTQFSTLIQSRIYSELDRRIANLPDISANLKEDYTFQRDKTHERQNLTTCLEQGVQIIIVSKSYDVELILAHLQHQRLFGGVKNKSLLHQVQLVTVPMFRTYYPDTTERLVAYAIRCLEAESFNHVAPITVNLYYASTNAEEREESVNRWKFYLKTPLEKKFLINEFQVLREQQFNFQAPKKIEIISVAHPSYWQAQHYQLTLWKTARCLRCKTYKIVLSRELPLCEICRLPLISFEELEALQREIEPILQKISQSGLYGDEQDSAIALRGEFTPPRLSTPNEHDSAVDLLQSVTQRLDYFVDDLLLFQRLKLYLAYFKTLEQNIHKLPTMLTHEMVCSDKTAVRYCPQCHVLYSDNEFFKICTGDARALIRISADKYWEQTGAIFLQNCLRGFSARQQFKLKQHIAKYATLFQRYALLEHMGRVEHQTLIPGEIIIGEVSPHELKIGDTYTLRNLLRQPSSSRTIKLIQVDWLRLVTILIIYKFHRDKKTAVAHLDKIHEYLVYDEAAIAICSSLDCGHIEYKPLSNGKNIYRSGGLCMHCDFAVTILISRPDVLLEFGANSLSAKQQEVEYELAMAEIFSNKPPTQVALLSRIAAVLPARQVLLTLPQLTVLNERFHRERSQFASLNKDSPAYIVKQKELKQLALLKEEMELAIKLREVICEFQLLKHFSYRHSCLLDKLTTIEPVSAIIANALPEDNPLRQRALANIGLKMQPVRNYSKLLISEDMSVRYRTRANAYFGAPLMPIKLSNSDRFASKSHPRDSTLLKSINLEVFEFESFLKQSILTTVNTTASILNINVEDNIRTGVNEAFREKIRQGEHSQIVIIAETWDLALVECYLNFIFPESAEHCIIITNPNSCHLGDAKLLEAHRPKEVLRQLQYLCQAVWAEQLWITDINLLHSNPAVLQAFLNEFSIKISNAKRMARPHKYAWYVPPVIKEERWSSCQMNIPQANLVTTSRIQSHERPLDVYYYEPGGILTKSGWVKFDYPD